MTGVHPERAQVDSAAYAPQTGGTPTHALSGKNRHPASRHGAGSSRWEPQESAAPSEHSPVHVHPAALQVCASVSSAHPCRSPAQLPSAQAHWCASQSASWNCAQVRW